MLYFLKREC